MNISKNNHFINVGRRQAQSPAGSATATIILVGCTALAIFFGLGSSVALGQEIGIPIADSSMEVGMVSVRVVNGSMSRPLSGLDVSLIDDENGKERVVRTGPDGRAPFRRLKPGQSFTAFIKVGDKEVSSQPLRVPDSGGLQILLSPKPISDGNEGNSEGNNGVDTSAARPRGGPMAGGPGGMPDPRMMSGMARGEQKDRAGLLTVRTVAGKFRVDEIAGRVADFPADAVIHLVGFHKNGEISLESKPVDEQGRVRFEDLALDHSVSYWVLSSFRRNGEIDRLSSSPLDPPPRVGLRLMLAGLANDSTKKGVDDLMAVRESKGQIKLPPAGNITLNLLGRTQGISEVELVRVSDGVVVATTTPSMSNPVTAVTGQVMPPASDAALKDGLIAFQLSGPSGPLEGVDVSVTAKDVPGKKTIVGRTDATGRATFSGLGSAKVWLARWNIHGKDFDTEFTRPIKGGVRINGSFSWRAGESVLQASFEGVSAKDWPIYIARVKSGGSSYFSPPFQMVDDRGVVARIFIYPDLLFKFQGSGELDDSKVWFQMRMDVINPSVAPLDVGDGGLLIPLPQGFVAASVSDENSTRVHVDKDHGFIWKGAVPPGTHSFVGQFALEVEGGSIHFTMPLPNGAFGSHLVIEDIPGMQLDVPTSAIREARQLGERNFIMLRQINIRPGQSLQLAIRGLPQRPPWMGLAAKAAGAGVIAFLLLGFGSILGRGRIQSGTLDTDKRALETKRQRILDQIVELDALIAQKGGSNKKRTQRKSKRAALIRKLEEIYRELEAAA